MFNKVTIIGDGAMGTVCAMLLCENGIHTTMWGHSAEQLDEFNAKRENSLFLPGYPLPPSLILDAQEKTALAQAELIVNSVPCQFVRGVWQRLKPHVPDNVPIVSVTKGVENKTLLRPTEVLEEVLGNQHQYASLSGPTIADELARKLPATATVACEDIQLAQTIQQSFNTMMFRVYTNEDKIGVELAGAMKNVIAIAAGIIDGIGAGDNAKAALISRGLAEIERLGVAMGANEKTFAGLSGLGDLVTTCISPKGRNRSFGQRIGQGMTTEQAVSATKSVVEGVATCESIVELAQKYKVEMPISEAIYSTITGQKTIQQAIKDLMSRSLKAE